jgi:starch synthase
MVAPEITPFAKTGGLADVLGSLPRALERLGVRVSLVMPAYRAVLEGSFPLEEMDLRFSVPVSDRWEEGTLLRTTLGERIAVYFVRADRYFDREYPYGTPEGDYPDNAERFVFFARAALEALRRDPPHVLHGHDWQSALAIAFLRAQPELYPELAGVTTVFTVHNLGYQGAFWQWDWHLLGLDGRFFTPKYLEFHGQINFLKGGLVFADAITTVSPTYAEEIKTREYGWGLEGVFQERAADLVGILNGVDYGLWSPETDPFIVRRYSRADLEGKRACKASLQRTFGLAVRPSVPLIGMTSRLVAQKGVDLVAEAIDGLLRRGVDVVIHGMGDDRYETFFRQMQLRYPRRVGVLVGYSEPLDHCILAGADLTLIPSRYEPCGLTQIYSLRYGTVPVVRATGGLKDTVQEFDSVAREGNGFVFGPYEPGALLEAVDRACRVYQRKEEWTALMRNAMSADFSWERPARAYLALYQRLTGITLHRSELRETPMSVAETVARGPRPLREGQPERVVPTAHQRKSG